MKRIIAAASVVLLSFTVIEKEKVDYVVETDAPGTGGITGATVRLITGNDTLVRTSAPYAVFKDMEAGDTAILIVTHPEYRTYLRQITISDIVFPCSLKKRH